MNNLDGVDPKTLEIWKQDAEKSTFFGVEIKNLNREELLSVIGFLSEDMKKSENNHKKHIDFLESCRKSRGN